MGKDFSFTVPIRFQEESTNHFVKNNSLLVLCISSIEFASPSIFSLPASFPCSLQSSTSFNMFRSQLLRQTARAVRASAAFPQPIASRTLPAIYSQRSIHNTTSLRQEEKKPGEEHEGQFARTDPTVEVEYADEAIVDLNKEEAQKQAEQLVAAFVKENPGADKVPKVTAHYADVSSQESVEAAIAEIISEHGKIDNLVTSAGFTENFEAINYPIERVRKLWGVNVDGTYLFAIAVAKHLMERKAPGSVVFIGSMSGAIVNVPQPQAPYNAAKAAVRHLASSLAVEWAHANIRVNCISPGYMLTALTKKILDDNPDLKKQWTSLIPQERWA